MGKDTLYVIFEREWGGYELSMGDEPTTEKLNELADEWPEETFGVVKVGEWSKDIN